MVMSRTMLVLSISFPLVMTLATMLRGIDLILSSPFNMEDMIKMV
jgi:hypothetical protein